METNAVFFLSLARVVLLVCLYTLPKHKFKHNFTQNKNKTHQSNTDLFKKRISLYMATCFDSY
jgi:hypothetical protein